MTESNQTAGANSRSGTKQGFTWFQKDVLYTSVCALDPHTAMNKKDHWYEKVDAPRKGSKNLKSHLHRNGVGPPLFPFLEASFEESILVTGKPPEHDFMVMRAQEIQSIYKVADETTESQQKSGSQKSSPVGTKRKDSGKTSRNTQKTNNTRELGKVSTRRVSKTLVQEKVTATKGRSGRQGSVPKVPIPRFLSEASTRPETQTDSAEPQPIDHRIGMDELVGQNFCLPCPDYLARSTLEITGLLSLDLDSMYSGYSLADFEADRHGLLSQFSLEDK